MSERSGKENEEGEKESEVQRQEEEGQQNFLQEESPQVFFSGTALCFLPFLTCAFPSTSLITSGEYGKCRAPKEETSDTNRASSSILFKDMQSTSSTAPAAGKWTGFTCVECRAYKGMCNMWDMSDFIPLINVCLLPPVLTYK